MLPAARSARSCATTGVPRSRRSGSAASPPNFPTSACPSWSATCSRRPKKITDALGGALGALAPPRLEITVLGAVEAPVPPVPRTDTPGAGGARARLGPANDRPSARDHGSRHHHHPHHGQRCSTGVVRRQPIDTPGAAGRAGRPRHARAGCRVSWRRCGCPTSAAFGAWHSVAAEVPLLSADGRALVRDGPASRWPPRAISTRPSARRQTAISGSRWEANRPRRQ